MRLNGVIFCVLAGIGSIFLACSRSDLISGVADGVVSDADSNLIDASRFVRIDLDGGGVDAAYSLPAGADPAFSTTFAGSVIAGVNGVGDTLAAYIQYNIGADTSSRYDSLELEGVYLYFTADTAAADSAGLSDSLSLDWVNPLKESAPVNRGADGRHPDADKDISDCPSDSAECEIAPVWPLKFTLSGGGAVDSVKLPRTAADKIFEAKRTSNADTIPFAFNIYYEKNGIRGIKNSYMAIVAYKAEEADSGKSVDTVHVRDTVRAEFSRYTAFEDADSVLNRKGLPYSSQQTKRTAVFEINLSKIKDSLKWDNGPVKYTNLNAVITIKPGSTLLGTDSSGYRIFVSDTLFDKVSDTVFLNEKFGGKNSSLVKRVQPYNTLPISAPTSASPSLQSVLDRKKERLYIYLRADSDNSAIIWDEPEPVRLETVFTPSQSR